MTIHKALLEVMNEVGYVQKTGKMDFGNTKYSYAGEVDLIKALRPALVKAGITFRCSGIDVINCDDFITYKEWNGKTTESLNHRFLAKYTFAFTHAESDTSIDAFAVGDGMDSGDKASYKAATGALKYALRQTFIIETGDDPDDVHSETSQTQYDGVGFIKAGFKTAKEGKDRFKEIKDDLEACEDLDQFISCKLSYVADMRKIWQADKKSGQELANIVERKEKQFNG
jgi:hypothetical protein